MLLLQLHPLSGRSQEGDDDAIAADSDPAEGCCLGTRQRHVIHVVWEQQCRMVGDGARLAAVVVPPRGGEGVVRLEPTTERPCTCIRQGR